MFRCRKTILAACLTVMTTPPALAESLQPPDPAEETVLAPATSSVGSTDILITVLAALLVWAAVQQNADTNGG